MAKTLREYNDGEREMPHHMEFGSDSTFERDPRKFCPSCSSQRIDRLRTHDPDSATYSCNGCRLTYTLTLVDEGMGQ